MIISRKATTSSHHHDALRGQVSTKPAREIGCARASQRSADKSRTHHPTIMYLIVCRAEPTSFPICASTDLKVSLYLQLNQVYKL